VSAKRTVKSSAKDTPSRGKADLRLLRRMSDSAIRHSAPPELPELPADFWDEAVPVVPEAKVPISLRVDSDVLEWFREEGPRYQSRMNAVLRSYMQRARKQPKKKAPSRTG
jgi:uncharacterized protein (DUF4415 family)